jgi:hypothetical protein
MIDHFLSSDYGKRPPLCEVEPDRQLVCPSVQKTPVLALVLNARSARNAPQVPRRDCKARSFFGRDARAEAKIFGKELTGYITRARPRVVPLDRGRGDANLSPYAAPTTILARDKSTWNASRCNTLCCF